jgi:hypothetical protein
MLPLALAQHFESTIAKPHALRGLANAWVCLAGRACAAVAAAWREALPEAT